MSLGNISILFRKKIASPLATICSKLSSYSLTNMVSRFFSDCFLQTVSTTCCTTYVYIFIYSLFLQLLELTQSRAHSWAKFVLCWLENTPLQLNKLWGGRISVKNGDKMKAKQRGALKCHVKDIIIVWFTIKSMVWYQRPKTWKQNTRQGISFVLLQ